MTLSEIRDSLNLPTDKNCAQPNGTHHYLGAYEKLFAPKRDLPINLLEIGVFLGGSMELWSHYFKNGCIYGVDVDLSKAKPETFALPNVVCIQKNVDLLDEWFLDGLMFDIVIDDGNHQPKQQLMTIELFKPRLNPGGILIIEDIQPYGREAMAQECAADSNSTVVDLSQTTGRWDDVFLLHVKPL